MFSILYIIWFDVDKNITNLRANNNLLAYMTYINYIEYVYIIFYVLRLCFMSNNSQFGSNIYVLLLKIGFSVNLINQVQRFGNR